MMTITDSSCLPDGSSGAWAFVPSVQGGEPRWNHTLEAQEGDALRQTGMGEWNQAGERGWGGGVRKGLGVGQYDLAGSSWRPGH